MQQISRVETMIRSEQSRQSKAKRPSKRREAVHAELENNDDEKVVQLHAVLTHSSEQKQRIQLKNSENAFAASLLYFAATAVRGNIFVISSSCLCVRFPFLGSDSAAANFGTDLVFVDFPVIGVSLPDANPEVLAALHHAIMKSKRI